MGQNPLNQLVRMADERKGCVSSDELDMTKKKKQQRRTKQLGKATAQKRKRPTERSARDQIELDVLAEQQNGEKKDAGTAKLIGHNSHICYLCGCRISAEQHTYYKCSRCGNRACFPCLELTDTLCGVCLSCKRKANRSKAIWDTIALIGIVIVAVIVLCLVIACLFFPEFRQTRFAPLGY